MLQATAQEPLRRNIFDVAWQFAMAHEVITMFIVIAILYTLERMVQAAINRHKPIVQCNSHKEFEEYEEDEIDETEEDLHE
jgi:hypothetical protein